MDDYEKSKSSTKRHSKLKKLLKIVYNYDQFKPKQYEIINRIINQEDVCAILPTGYGKSLTYQMPGIYLDKPAIIISPLISLMNDQQMILADMDITSCCYNSSIMHKDNLKREILNGDYQFIYITPESIVRMEEFLKKMRDGIGISLIAIDEAHCISSYGFDFRNDYRKLSFLKTVLPDVPILAVTATATQQVANDICNVLGLNNEEIIQTSFDRPNLYLEVRKKLKKKNGVSTTEEIIHSIIQKYPGESIIIYCISKKQVEKMKQVLDEVYKIKCDMYHAGMTDVDKKRTHENFLKNNIQVVVATIAFGMGINKSDVRVVIHYGAPKSVEGYYQEIGRAGRDGKKSFCYMFFSDYDFDLQETFINNTENENYRRTQYKLLEKMKKYAYTKECRRKVLLEYFDEDSRDNCDFCDNCCGTKYTINKQLTTMTTQNVHKEAKMLIDLIEEMDSKMHKNFGLAMYINILRKSANKTITADIKKSKYYGAGSNRSIDWWKELADNLIQKGFIMKIQVRGKFGMHFLKVTHQGSIWSNMSELDDFLDGFEMVKLDPIEMVATI